MASIGRYTWPALLGRGGTVSNRLAPLLSEPPNRRRSVASSQCMALDADHVVAVWDNQLWVIGGFNGLAANEDEIGTEEGNRNDVW